MCNLLILINMAALVRFLGKLSTWTIKFVGLVGIVKETLFNGMKGVGNYILSEGYYILSYMHGLNMHFSPSF